MTATASVAKLESGAATRPGVGPIVMIGGRPVAELWVRSVTMDGAADRRSATIGVVRSGAGFDAAFRSAAAAWIGQAVTIVQPISVAGGESRLIPLMTGMIDGETQRLDGKRDELTLTATCNWARVLQTPVSAADLKRPGGGAWLLGELLERLEELGAGPMSVTLVPGEVLGRAVSAAAGGTLGTVLDGVLEEQGLVVQRAFQWEGHGVGESRSIRMIDRGRRVRLRLDEVANPSGVVEAIRSAVPAARPRKLMVQANGQVVESTMALVGGWDATEESLADTAYAKSGGGDFDAAADVFRLWVLNEDGAYSGEPFDRGPAFSLTELFEEDRAVEPVVVVLGDCLTRDSGGVSAGVVVEVSTDDGAAWSRYPGRVTVLADRAGVYLDDDELPPGWIAAVRSGTGRVRVTASVRDPLPVEAVRWVGNPLAGAFEATTWAMGSRFSVRRVLASSKYDAEVRSGSRTADEADDRPAMAAWLVNRAALGQNGDGTADVACSSIQCGLRIGDRLEVLSGRAMGLDLSSGFVGATGAWLQRIVHRWDTAESELRWRVGAPGGE